MVRLHSQLQYLIASISESCLQEVQGLGCGQLSPMMFASQWFLCAFVGTALPTETICRIWDFILTKGPDGIFSIALAVVQVSSSTVCVSWPHKTQSM
jgi:hypothetical protein